MQIYKLFEIGKEDIIHYIGQTKKPIHKRLTSHKSTAKQFTGNLYLYNWIRSVNYKIGIEVIDSANNQKELDDKEAYWISYYRKLFSLKNIADGGGAHSGLKGELNPKAQRVLQYSMKGEFIKKIPT